MLHDFKGKRVLVTGAASGIGRATALEFARAGADLVICCDRNEKGLAEVAREITDMGRKAFTRRVDVSQRDQMKAFADDVLRECGPLDVLVNNAGVSLVGGTLDMTLEDWDEIMGANLWGVIYGCHFFLPPMIARKRGHVVNVASASSFVSFAGSVAYSTTKFGVLGFTEGLRAELAPFGIGVTTLCPGLTKTSICDNTMFRGQLAVDDVRTRFVDQVSKGAPPAKLANAILDAIAKNRGVVAPTLDAWAAYMMKRISPALTRFVGVKFAESMTGKRAL